MFFSAIIYSIVYTKFRYHNPWPLHQKPHRGFCDAVSSVRAGYIIIYNKYIVVLKKYAKYFTSTKG